MSNFFQYYFSRGSGSSCLDDNPSDFMHEPSIFHNKLPGQIMNGSLQCQLQYGADHYQCPQRIVRPYLVFFYLMYTAQVEITNHRFECSKTVPIALYHCLFQSTKTNPTSKRVVRLCSHYAAGSREIALVPDTKT